MKALIQVNKRQDETLAIRYTADTLNIEKKEAEELLFGEDKINDYLKYNKSLSDIG